MLQLHQPAPSWAQPWICCRWNECTWQDAMCPAPVVLQAAEGHPKSTLNTRRMGSLPTRKLGFTQQKRNFWPTKKNGVYPTKNCVNQQKIGVYPTKKAFSTCERWNSTSKKTAASSPRNPKMRVQRLGYSQSWRMKLSGLVSEMEIHHFS